MILDAVIVNKQNTALLPSRVTDMLDCSIGFPLRLESLPQKCTVLLRCVTLLTIKLILVLVLLILV